MRAEVEPDWLVTRQPSESHVHDRNDREGDKKSGEASVRAPRDQVGSHPDDNAEQIHRNQGDRHGGEERGTAVRMDVEEAPDAGKRRGVDGSATA